MQDNSNEQQKTLTFEDWCSAAGAHFVFDPDKERELREAWERGDDPATWVLKKYLM